MGRTGESWRVLATAPWRRAPLLLRGQPAVLSAVLFSGLILGAASAAVPLFESSVASAANAKQIAQRCPATVGFMLTTAGTLSGRTGANEAPGVGSLEATELLDRRQAAVELDHQAGERLLEAIGSLRAEGISFLIASHDQAVVRLADRVLQVHDGAVVKEVA